MNASYETTKFVIELTFGLISLSLITMAIYYWIKAQKTNQWPYINGQILSSEIIKEELLKEFTYKPLINYSFKLNNIEYTSNRINVFFKYGSTTSYAYKLIKKYPKGSSVKVYYNPNNPKDSVLERRITKEILILMILGVILILGSYLVTLK